jgi:hypothetical protein
MTAINKPAERVQWHLATCFCGEAEITAFVPPLDFTCKKCTEFFREPRSAKRIKVRK